MLFAVEVPDGVPGKRFRLFLKRQPRGEIPCGFGGFDFLRRFEEAAEKRLAHVLRADDPRADAVDGCVEVIQSDFNAPGSADGDFASEIEKIVVLDNHMIAVPADAAADVKEDAALLNENRGELVGDGFRRVEVSHVEADCLVVFCRVGEIEVMRADGAAFGSDAEEFGFDCVEHECGIDGIGENFIKAFHEAAPRSQTVGGGVFESVGSPEVADGADAGAAGELRGDAAARFAVVNPESADGGVGMRE